MAGMTEEHAQELITRWAELERAVRVSGIRNRLVTVLGELVSADVVADLAEGHSGGDDEHAPTNLVVVGVAGALIFSITDTHEGFSIWGKLLTFDNAHVIAKFVERNYRESGRIIREWTFDWSESRSSIQINHEVQAGADDELAGALRLAKAVGWPAP